MNRRLPFSPNETDAILYVIISVLLLMSVNQVLSQPRIMENVTASANMCRQKTTHTGSLPYENLFSTSLTNSSGKIAMAAPLSLKNLLENQSTPLTSKVNVCANIVIDEKEMAILSGELHQTTAVDFHTSRDVVRMVKNRCESRSDIEFIPGKYNS